MALATSLQVAHVTLTVGPRNSIPCSMCTVSYSTVSLSSFLKTNLGPKKVGAVATAAAGPTSSVYKPRGPLSAQEEVCRVTAAFATFFLTGRSCKTHSRVRNNFTPPLFSTIPPLDSIALDFYI